MQSNLEPPDSFYLSAAIGWLELGSHKEANDELEKITPGNRVHPDVLEVRWHIYSHAKNWPLCVDIADAMIKLAPESADAWINRSFALHEMSQTEAAYDQLLPAAEKFPTVWTIPYNLACYCAQSRRLDECQEWFKKAMSLDEQTVKRNAIDDPDLKPLWGSMSGTIWKRTE